LAKVSTLAASESWTPPISSYVVGDSGRKTKRKGKTEVGEEAVSGGGGGGEGEGEREEKKKKKRTREVMSEPNDDVRTVARIRATGITVDDAVPTEFEKTKLRKIATWMLFTIQDESVKVHSMGSEDPAGLCAMIHGDFECEPCYGIVSVDFESSDGRPMNKLCFVSWIPDAGKIEQKMKHAGTKDAFIAAVPGISDKLQATDASELTVDELVVKCSQFS
jgi:hypothetical protein